MINPNNELFKWGPIDGRPIYIYPFVEAFEIYPQFIDGTWPDTVGFFKDDKITFVLDDAESRKNGEHLFKKYILDEKKLKKAYDEWLPTVDKIREFEKKVNEGISEEELGLFTEWDKAHVDFWVKIFLPEFGNWGGEQMLKRKILEFNKINFIEIFEGLSAPEKLSFFQKEELELMKIKLIDDKNEQLKKLEQHKKKYYWLRNSYAFTKVLDVNFFKKELDNISKEQAEKKIEEISNYSNKVKQKKQELIKKYDISKEIIEIADKLSYCVWWQDYRKQFIFIANHINTKFLEKISKAKNIDFKELCYYCSNEITDLLENNKKTDAKPRFAGFIMYYHERKGTTYKTGKEACDFIRPYIDVEIDKNMKEFGGMVVSKGDIVKGKVKILLTPRNTQKMQKEDILVAPMTSPDYIIAMRKASAIITDEGGITCHAAIVSRELGIPCIVATNIASKLLKDNDLIEVDTNKGVVKILKK